MTEEESRWSEYYAATAARRPRPLLADALTRFDTPGRAIDLGSGAGVESLELLRQGWQVLAIDQEPDAAEYLRASAPPDSLDRLQTRTASFKDLALPITDLVWSSLSLSFCERDDFEDLWSTILACIEVGGLLACDVFGDRHAWFDPNLTFLTEPEMRSYLEPLDVESFAETESERQTASKGIQHWHAYEVIARKR